MAFKINFLTEYINFILQIFLYIILHCCFIKCFAGHGLQGWGMLKMDLMHLTSQVPWAYLPNYVELDTWCWKNWMNVEDCLIVKVNFSSEKQEMKLHLLIMLMPWYVSWLKWLYLLKIDLNIMVDFSCLCWCLMLLWIFHVYVFHESIFESEFSYLPRH